jgi:hypothetical protein
MANRKISDLTALTAPASGDLLPIVDISEAAAANKNKKITIGELFASIPIGSAAAPSVAFEGDNNTGIYSPGADQVAISTNGTGRLFVNASGNVGIATNSPGATFDANGTAFARGGQKIQGYFSPSAGDGNVINIGTTGGINYIQSLNGTTQSQLSFDGNPIVFRGASFNEIARFDTSGRLGLGTSSPTELLEIKGSEVSIQIRNDLPLTTNTLIGGLKFYKDDGSGGAGLAGSITCNSEDSVGNASYVAFSTKGTSVANAEKVRIDSSGRVGIGTTGPSNQLHVSSTSNTPVQFQTTGGAACYLYFSNTGGGGYLSTQSDNLVFHTSGAATERARIDSSGRLLVGGSTDSGGALLQVFGDRIRIGTAKTPASATATGTAGEICWDANYIYVCTATNTWKRSAISTW